MKKLTVQDVELSGRRVLMRVDFNVPMDKSGTITDDTRIRASLATIEFVLAHGGTPVLMSHFGRPDGERDDKYSLRPVAAHLQELLGRTVHFGEDCIGAPAQSAVRAAAKGDVVLLENVRFHPGETKNDPAFAAELAALGDLYVNDAFGTAHRAHASTVGVTTHFQQRASGLLMDKELENLGGLLQNPRRPFVAVLGGAKVSGKIEVIDNLIGRVDSVLIGGGMAFTFFRALGLDTGASLVEEGLLDTVKGMLERAKRSSTELVLPEDLVVAERFEATAAKQEVLATDIPDGWMGLDIGPRSVRLFCSTVEGASTIFWNGPMGVFEMEAFAKGTRAMARAIAAATESGARSVVGGGDSVAALAQTQLTHKITHVSTGGGASLEFMGGAQLPGVAALSDAAPSAV